MSEFHAIVIGSGFGGSVAACRLAQAGLSVCLLERGRRYGEGAGCAHFPRSFTNPLTGWLWRADQGLFDVRPFNEVQTVQAAGYGGGSLIYANVHLRAPPDIFDHGWPAGHSRAALDPYYDLVAHMLDLQPIPEEFAPKTAVFERAAERLGRKAQSIRPPLAVAFDRTGRDFTNKFGARQHGCIGCGECDIGCRVGAKNTLDKNYLFLAERHGAEVRTLAEAFCITRRDVGGYVVSYRDHAGNGARFDVGAQHVFVCAGAINSTELLLRCRYEHGTLPDLSDRIGYRYWANADNIALAFDAAEPIGPDVGPTITAAVAFRGGPPSAREWFLFQDGGYPAALAPLLQLVNPGGANRPVRRPDKAAVDAALAGTGQPPADDAVARSAVFLFMGRDLQPGRIRLTPLPGLDDPLNIDWDYGANASVYEAEERFARDLAGALGAETVFNPAAHFARVPVSVHSLGGCAMGDCAALGVTDAWGEVHHYPGLYVLDGAAIPVSLGVNPSHTIAALAERNVEHHIRRILGRSGWEAPERSAAPPFRDPLDRCDLGHVPPLVSPGAGLAFRETMRGFHLCRPAAPEDFDRAAAQGRLRGTRARFVLDIDVPGVRRFTADRRHRGNARGRLTLDGLTTPQGSEVADGAFELFVSPIDASMYQRQMRYALPFTGADGMGYVFEGVKNVADDPGRDLWPDLTTLYFKVFAGEIGGTVVSSGILRLSLWDFLRQLLSFRIRGADGPWARLAVPLPFLRHFGANLWRVYVAARFAPGGRGTAAQPRRAHAVSTSPALPTPQPHPFRTEDGADLLLTRYRGGSKGPVILSHGAGVWSGTYTIETTQTNFARYLVSEGYDVWLLDWRASICLPRRQFTLDEVSLYDYPAAIDLVLHATGADSVQAIAHCMGANTLIQAAARGLLRDKVRSIGLSALGLHYEAPLASDIKAQTHLPELFRRNGIDYFSCREHPEHVLLHEAWSRFVDLYHFECDSTVCHRLSFMYGTPFLHSNLNKQTHDRLEEQFGWLNMTTFSHIAQNVRRGTAAAFDYGEAENLRRYGRPLPPTYLDPTHLALPITLITGRQNVLWEWQSLQKTSDWLRTHHDPALYRLRVLDGYGHQDLFWGVDAPRDVYPLWLAFLEEHP